MLTLSYRLPFLSTFFCIIWQPLACQPCSIGGMRFDSQRSLHGRLQDDALSRGPEAVLQGAQGSVFKRPGKTQAGEGGEMEKMVSEDRGRRYGEISPIIH